MDDKINLCSEYLLKDPLEGCGTNDPHYYKLENKVFAEPIDIFAPEEHNQNGRSTHNHEEITFIGNVTVQKVAGKKYKRYHLKVDPDNPMCPQPDCRKSFKTTTLLRAHIRRHCSDRSRFQCEMCSKSFGSKHLLQRHTAVHEGRKRECPVCGKMISERTNYSAHARTHTGERPHACAQCGKRLATSASLRRHVTSLHPAAPAPAAD